LPGSLGYEELDAETFKDWGVDFVKYDNCYTDPFSPAKIRYTKMSKALKESNENIFFSICNWGQGS
jgi:alpha-galactosidase